MASPGLPGGPPDALRCFPSLSLAELVGDEFFQRIDCFGGLRALGFKLDGGAKPRTQQKQPHD